MSYSVLPSKEDVSAWLGEYVGCSSCDDVSSIEFYIAVRAAQWGADQELEACCEVLHQHDRAYLLPSQLRAVRRPKPPSLAEEALAELNLTSDNNGAEISFTQVELIRRALERLQELKEQQ